MSEFAACTRSNSSIAFRKNLKENFVIVPDLSPKVHVRKYFDLARTLYYQAAEAYKRNSLQDAYIDFHKFQILVLVKLARHPDYAQLMTTENKEWLHRAKICGVAHLECITAAFDAAFDEAALQLQDRKREKLLSAAFDDNLSEEGAREIPSHVNNESDGGNSSFSTNIAERLRRLQLGGEGNVGTAIRDQTTLSPQSQMGSTSNVVLDGVLSLPVIENQPSDIGTDGVVPNMAVKTFFYVADILLLVTSPYGFRKIPAPTVHSTELVVNDMVYKFLQDDFHVSFLPFMPYLDLELQMHKGAIETNRCFFLHLGVAIGIHPYILQTAFRYFSFEENKKKGCWYTDILEACLEYASFVDANILSLWWPAELSKFRICLISGGATQPMFSSFSCATTPPAELEDVLIRCSKGHFTLWKPQILQDYGARGGKRFEVLEKLFKDAEEGGMVVQRISTTVIPRDDPDPKCRRFHSIATAIQALKSEMEK